MDAGTKMIKANRLRQVFMEDKRPAMGFWQMLPGANISRALASAGADWVMVDCEHGVMNGIDPFISLLRSLRKQDHRMDGQLTSKQTQRCTKQSQPLRLLVFRQLSGFQTSSLGW
jgi:hypothetical protein